MDPLALTTLACRPGCAACCIAPSISSPLPGMPQGKPAGVRCVNLNADNLCQVWNTPAFPAICRTFPPRADVCGQTNQEALANLTRMEELTHPQRG